MWSLLNWFLLIMIAIVVNLEEFFSIKLSTISKVRFFSIVLFNTKFSYILKWKIPNWFFINLFLQTLQRQNMQIVKSKEKHRQQWNIKHSSMFSKSASEALKKNIPKTETIRIPCSSKPFKNSMFHIQLRKHSLTFFSFALFQKTFRIYCSLQ